MLSVIRNKWISFYLLLFAFGSLVLFLYGFFPIEYRAGKIASWNDLPMHVGEVSIDGQELFNPGDVAVVVMVIDALRYDFVTEEYMPFTAQLLKNKTACLHIAMAEPPTVTMPRIKAMMTGSVSTFADVALNFGAPAVTGDSVVRAAHTRGRVTAMYGDDTWLRLFPDLWTRSEGTSSFYVSDYTEVDKNVTRHLDFELYPDPTSGRPPFDLLVLHYLGLDHIGHLEGPASPKIKPKLQEMDDIVKMIFIAMKSWNMEGALFVCGDHGMRDSGGHGGSSPAELLVPLVLAKTDDYVCPHHWLSPPIVQQVDVAPSLAYLTRSPMPGDSRGRVLSALLPRQAANRLYLLHYNAKRNSEILLEVLGQEEGVDKECYKQYLRAVRHHEDWLKTGQHSLAKMASDDYAESLQEMARYLSESTTDFDMFSISLGIALLAVTFTSLVLATLHSLQPEEKMRYSITYTRRITTRYGTLVAVIIVTICCIVTLVLSCAITETQSSMCKLRPQWLLAMAAVTSLLVFNFFLIKAGSEYAPDLKAFSNLSKSDYVLLAGSIIHCFSFLSTSFIEEEHQTWYFFWNILMLVVLLRILGTIIRYIQKGMKGATEFMEKPILGQKMISFNNIVFSRWVLLIGLHRFLRTMNQTGDRWAFLPDTADWLNEPQNQYILQAFMVTGLLATAYICLKGLQNTKNICKANSLLTLLAFGCILCYKHSTNALHIPFIDIPKSDSIVEVQLFWCLLITMMAVEILSYCSEFAAVHRLKLKDVYKYEDADISYEKYVSNAYSVRHRLRSQNSQDNMVNGNAKLRNDYKNDRVRLTKDSIKLKLARALSLIVLNNLMMTIVLLMRPHNTIMVPSIYATCKIASTAWERDVELDMERKDSRWQLRWLIQTLLHIWIGMVFFFYQGNSNSLASVDLGAGYVGLREYQPAAVALRMGLHAYAAPAIAGMILFVGVALMETEWASYRNSVAQCMNVIALTRVFQDFVYSCIAVGFRHHICVWTVFSPKLLYDFTATTFAIVALFTIIIIYLVTNLAQYNVFALYSFKTSKLRL